MKAVGIGLMLAIVMTLAAVGVAGAQGPSSGWGIYDGYSPQTFYLNNFSFACPSNVCLYGGNGNGAYNRFGGGYFPPFRRFGGGYAYGPYLRFGGGYGVTPYSYGWSYSGY
jgi:hypothetical protein